MQIAIDCAGFSPSEADRLRQAMSSKRAPERIEELRARLLEGMAERGITLDVAEDIYEKILAFSSYGFPESHAISFAYLVYASAWLKCYYPAAFTAALLRAQPMGFYSPASLISDVRRHGVEIRGVDVNASGVLAVLESAERESQGRSTGRTELRRRPERREAGARPGESPCPASPPSGSACPRCATSARTRPPPSWPASRTPISRTSPGGPRCRCPRSRRWRPLARSGASGCRGARRCGRRARRRRSRPGSCRARPSG